MPSPTSPLPSSLPSSSSSSKPTLSPPRHGLWRWRCTRCRLSLPIVTAPICPNCGPRKSRFRSSSIEFDISGWGRFRRRRRVDEVLEAEKRAEREVLRLRGLVNQGQGVKVQGQGGEGKMEDQAGKMEDIDFGFPTPPSTPPREGSLTSNPVRTPLPGMRPLSSSSTLLKTTKERAIKESLERRRMATLREGKGNCWEDCDFPGECHLLRREAMAEEEEEEENEDEDEEETEEDTEEEEGVDLKGSGIDWTKEEEITGMEVKEWMERERTAKGRLMGETTRALGVDDS